MLYKIVERNNNKGECGERLHAFKRADELSSRLFNRLENIEFRLQTAYRSLLLFPRFYVWRNDWSRVDLISKNFLAWDNKACTFILFLSILTIFFKNTIWRKYKMCTVIEKLITIDNLFDWKVSYVRGSKEFSYLYCKIIDFKKKIISTSPLLK